MSQYDRDISGQTSGNQLVDDFNQSMEAIHSGHIGPTRPQYATEGMIWTREGDPDHLMYFDGNADVELFALNAGLYSQFGVPAGCITLWSGAVANIPEGWALCDGQSGTPDLRGRFVLGAGGDYDPEETGGAEEATLQVTNLPAHDHADGTLTTSTAGNHNHGASTSTAGAHAHRSKSGGFAWSILSWLPGVSGGNHDHIGLRKNNSGVQEETASAGSHAHTVTVNYAGSHNHDVTGRTGSTGSGTPISIVPPYFALCYIMKV